jgi:hypothetical protein
MPDPIDTPATPSPQDTDATPREITAENPALIADAVSEDASDPDSASGEESEAPDESAAEDAASETASGTSSAASSGTSGGTARGIDEHAIEKWSPEQQKVFNAVKEKAQEIGVAKDDVQRIAAFSVLNFIAEKDRKPDTRVDRVQAVNANGDTIVRMEHMKYGDREPIFTNDVRLKDAPAFDQTAAQIEQANQRLHTKSAAEQNIAMHQQNQDNNQHERMNALQATEDQVMARVQSSSPAIKR